VDPKTGKTYKREIKGDEARAFANKKVGDKISGDGFGLSGYEFLISGGSDYCGFPMRKDVLGTARKRVLISSGVGIRSKRKGMRKRKTVAATTIIPKTSQINLKILKYGKAKLGGEAPKEEKPVEEKKPEEKPKEAPKEKPKKEEKPKEESKEKPAKKKE
jgi:small subunit ribosomal protein S6e